MWRKHRSVSIFEWGVRLFQSWVLLMLGLLVSSLACAEPVKQSKTLEQIQKKGIIRIGVKTDFSPFGMLNAKGEAEGFEIDLAQDIAKTLGVSLVTVSLTTENRFQKLEQGDVDVVIATTADTLERRQVATAIEPNYYAGGVSIFLRPHQRISEWQAMRGQKICATQGAYFNRPMSQRYLLELQMYRSTRDALLALRDGRCIGFLYSSAAIQAYLKKPEWVGYHAPLAPAMVAPWAINVSRKEQGTELDHLLGNLVADWHRRGFLIERESAWGIQPTKFLADSQVLWNQRDARGRYLCTRNASGDWPTGCRNPTFVRSNEVGGLLKLGLWIEESTGMKLSFIYDNYDRGLFIKGMLYTLTLMSSCIVLSLVLGTVGAVMSESRHRWLGFLVRSIAVHGRMTPPLLQMYLLFFGVGTLIYNRLGLSLSPLWVAVWCLGYYTGASVMSAVLEAANHIRVRKPEFRLTFSNLHTIVELSAVTVKAALINVVKQSVMTSALAVPELISATTAIMSDQGNVNVMMNVFLLVFVLLITLWIRVLDWLEHRVRSSHGIQHG